MRTGETPPGMDGVGMEVREACAGYVVEAGARVPKGYKQTEVGVIPEDWEVTCLYSLTKGPMQNGLFFKPSLKGSGVKLINVGDLYGRIPIASDALELFDATDKERERFKVRDGDLFFTRSSVVPSGIAQCNYYCSPKPESVVFDSHVIRLRADTSKVVPSFLFRFCVASIARQYLVSHAKTGTMTTIDQGVLGKCPVLLPPHSEQESIAESLSDADDLIESLEQLLAKKRQIKQGAMQELLTGKKRLPGFEVKPGKKQSDAGLIPEDWRVESIEQISTVGRGRVISHKEIARSLNPQYPVYSSQTSNEGVMGYTDTFEFEGEYITWTTDGANAGTVFARDGRFNCTNVCGTIKLKADNHLFVAKILGGIAPSHVSRHLGNPKLMNDVMKRVKVPLPPTKAEQEAIATVVSDMDAELAALEEKLAKARQLKQGMMQELLTGRIRLI